MPNFENPSSGSGKKESEIKKKLKRMATYGAIALGTSGAVGCAPGAGDKAGAMTSQDASAEQAGLNSPEKVQERLLDGMKLGLNDLGDGAVALVAIGEGMSQDGAEDMARSQIDDMKKANKGYAFLPTSGAPKVEKASNGSFYVVVKIVGSEIE